MPAREKVNNRVNFQGSTLGREKGRTLMILAVFLVFAVFGALGIAPNTASAFTLNKSSTTSSVSSTGGLLTASNYSVW